MATELPLVQLDGPFPQHVPSRACLECPVCCHFPEADSFLRPYFTEEEIRGAVARGVPSGMFPNPRGGQIELVPHPSGEGFLCPAFDPEASQCRIYDARPLDCQLYPLALMWSSDGAEVLLGWDAKCPFLAERGGARGDEAGDETMPGAAGRSGETLEQYAERVAARLEREEMIEPLAAHPRLIGPFQEDVVVLRSLPRLTARLRSAPTMPSPASASSSGLRPLTPADAPCFTTALSEVPTPLAAFALPTHLLWRSLFTYRWAELEGRLCLFAEYQDGLFMPLPPLGDAPLAPAAAHAFAVMREWNRGTAVSRIENVPEQWTADLEALGYRLSPKDPDYLYDVRNLVTLHGDRYKSQRALCNRFVREQRFEYRPYTRALARACLDLYRRWTSQKDNRRVDGLAAALLEDARSAHEEALHHHDDLGLVGRIITIENRVVAYTFGYACSPGVFCIALEIADRTIPGLAQFLFRRFCEEAAEQGATWVNTMDDSGLASLRRSKLAYRPERLVPSFIATEARLPRHA
ncbi:phosphatidylglycerol lysyltransferase domain-containing protein [Candidatus Nitrospira bockiana]